MLFIIFCSTSYSLYSLLHTSKYIFQYFFFRFVLKIVARVTAVLVDHKFLFVSKTKKIDKKIKKKTKTKELNKNATVILNDLKQFGLFFAANT